MKKEYPVCTECGGTNIVFDGAIQWDRGKQDFFVLDVYDKGCFCGDCEGECRVKWEKIKNES